ncbi:hypothetical protein NM208_g12266 [Fusarium decemcellulare]|uniref:Uncharacterized protein n=1 Tax=Fusarium decemcellulare TaxID=57161 RepID=A0ACC1RPP4_9HYPO|nr:hypothetical protein NM208_g12266 [Fusarium decemcellulare]
MDKRYKSVQPSNYACTDTGATMVSHVYHDGYPGTGRDLNHLLDSLSAANKVAFVENLEKLIAFLTDPNRIPLDRPEPKGNDFEKEITKNALKLLLLPYSTDLPQGNHDLNGVRDVEEALTTHGTAASASRNSIDVLHESHDPSGAHAVKSPLATYGAAGQAFCKAVGWVLPCKVSEMRLNKNPQVEVPVDEIKPGGPFRGKTPSN